MFRCVSAIRLFTLITVCQLLLMPSLATTAAEPKILTYHGYPDCIQLENDSIRVVLCPAAGGRVLEYSSQGQNNYVMYEPGNLINFTPTDPHIRTRDGFLEIIDVPREPKLGMDSIAGWFAYLMRNDKMFIKRFPVYPNRVYNEIAGLTISIWYPEDRRVELEPIGPLERLQPGEKSEFTEEWFLLPFEFPATGQDVDLQAVERLVKRIFAKTTIH